MTVAAILASMVGNVWMVSTGTDVSVLMASLDLTVESVSYTG